MFRPFRARRILIRIGSPGPTPQAGFPPPGLACRCPFGAKFRKRNFKTFVRGNGVINEAGCWNYLVGMTLGAIHVSQVPQRGWPLPLPPPIGCKLSTNRKRKPKWRRCGAASSAVGPSAIPTGSRTRPSDWGSNARFGPVEDRRNNRRLATFTCALFVLQIWWLSPFTPKTMAAISE